MVQDGYNIGGVQQIGLGVQDLEETFRWYRRNLGVDILVFDEDGEVNLMLQYTGGKPHMRRAILACNAQGGSGFEIWQYKSREPQPARVTPQIGDLGIFTARIKARDVPRTYELFRERGLKTLGEVCADPSGAMHFYLRDPAGNLLEIVKGEEWFQRGSGPTGGTCGCLIGVSDVENALPLYEGILGYDRVIYDETGVFEDLSALPGGAHTVRRVLLAHSLARVGPFSRWLGKSRIELVQVKTRAPRKIFEDRYWGDPGFIHLCFDVGGMDSLKRKCDELGFGFTVDSASSFDMGAAAGHFSYVEDPDGTLIEFVETHKIPLIKKLGWYLDLKRRNPFKPLPDWMIRTLSLTRIRD